MTATASLAFILNYLACDCGFNLRATKRNTPNRIKHNEKGVPLENAFSLDGLFTLPNLFTFLMLVLLQAVLGFDNLLYITIESRRVEPSRQAFVRRMGIGVALGFRLILLFVILLAFNAITQPLFSSSLGFLEGEFTLRALLTIAGGAFIMWTAMKEIWLEKYRPKTLKDLFGNK